MATKSALPRWLGPASRLNVLLLRLGVQIGTQHVLSVPGRKTGRLRSTPVSLVTLNDTRYIVSEAVNLPPAASARGRKVSGTDQHGDLVGV